jgi:AAA family ATP:ADP antiporter
LIVCCIGLVMLVHHWQVTHGPIHRAAEARRPVSKDGAFSMIQNDRYLTLITMLIVVLNIVDTSGEYILGRMLVDESVMRFGDSIASSVERERFVGAMFGRFYSIANLIGFLMQMFLVSRVFKVVGIGNALLFQPIIAMAGSLLLLQQPSLLTLGWFKVTEKSTDYSLGNTSRHALWLPTSRAAKYKAKQAVDTLFLRLGDLLQAGVVYVGQLLSFGVPAFALLNLALAVGWTGVWPGS